MSAGTNSSSPQPLACFAICPRLPSSISPTPTTRRSTGLPLPVVNTEGGSRQRSNVTFYSVFNFTLKNPGKPDLDSSPTFARSDMLTKRIIACLDVDDGRVVKGVQFVNLRDAGAPAELAKRRSDSGADEIVLLDISAAHQRRATLLDTVRRP